MDGIASPCFKKCRGETINNTEESSILNQNKQTWYTDECRERKYIFLRMLDKYRNSKTDENRKFMVKERSEYKTILRKCRQNYDKDRTNKFVNAKYKNAKLYWNMLKVLANVKPANISLSSF